MADRPSWVRTGGGELPAGGPGVLSRALEDGDATWEAAPPAEIIDGSVTPAKLSFDPATQAELDAHLGDAADAHDASAVSVNPSGLIVVTDDDVQGAIAELDAAVAQAQDDIDDLATGLAGGRVLRRGSIAGDSAVGNGTTLGATKAEGSTPLRALNAPIGALPVSVTFDAGELETTGAAGAFVLVYIEWSPAGAETWTGLGFLKRTTRGASDALGATRVLPFNPAAGNYDFRVAFSGSNAAHIATIKASAAGTGVIGPATLTIRED